jgi:hypothetical protein
MYAQNVQLHYASASLSLVCSFSCSSWTQEERAVLESVDHVFACRDPRGES